tara:strand:+ start:13562 stop:13741 length:180 start_codon:yes stop_codon:yes gene_type:complete
MTVQTRLLGKQMLHALYDDGGVEAVYDCVGELQERLLLLERRMENAEKQIVKLLAGDSE